MANSHGLIGAVDPIAGLQIEMILMAFNDYPYPQLTQTMSADEFMFEWWSIEKYENENEKKHLLFTYHKLEHRLNAYYDISPPPKQN